MSEKYVNIEQESCNRTQDQKEALMEIASHDIIFVLSYPDTQYPSYSDMNMGQFCEVAYRRGNKIIWQVFNPEVTKPIDDFITKLGDRVLAIVEQGAFTAYLGKSLGEFRTAQHNLIYKDKYCFKSDGSVQFDSILEDALARRCDPYYKLWKATTETFPDENLRQYFEDWKNFHNFCRKMDHAYSGEETRFWNMFDICPELRSITDKTDDNAIAAIEWWASENKWNG